MLNRETSKCRQCKRSVLFIFKEYFVYREDTTEFWRREFVLCLSSFPFGGEKKFAPLEPVPLREEPISKQAAWFSESSQ